MENELMSEQVVYVGRDLEAMFFARNYHRWIADAFRPFLGRRLVEVGAGTGGFSELLLETGAESISLIEPSTEQHGFLAAQARAWGGAPRIETYNATFREVASRVKEAQGPDSILYVNVLEHIADDEGELRAMWETLGPGGRVFIFVPAMQWLYGNFDKDVGHFRRYTRPELEAKCRAAGFRVIKSSYFDLMGVVPWWIQYRLFKASTLKPGAVKLYDRLVVPLTRAVESLAAPPVGKNLLLVAEKPRGAAGAV